MSLFVLYWAFHIKRNITVYVGTHASRRVWISMLANVYMSIYDCVCDVCIMFK